MRPIIGITCDRAPASDRYHSIALYAQAVEQAGGLPILLPHHTERISDYLSLCHGFIFSGGDDPDTTAFGEPTHPKADVMHPDRQRFELALLDALDHTRQPVLGICLGMQLMALHHGGKLHQHLPDLGADIAERHARGEHKITWQSSFHPIPLPSRAGPGEGETREHDHIHESDPSPNPSPPWGSGGSHTQPATSSIFSKHHQAVAEPGRMRVAAVAPDGIIEAITGNDPNRFYLGVQWHPERTEMHASGGALFERLIEASRD